ncbi:MAG: site-specific integrase [Muribaculaceae bacterium]|nr:site-specific integrase [Muribaculaceae bacterium]
MATIHPIILPAKALKGGRHKIRISVAHNGETRYIVTNIVIDSFKEYKNGVIVKRPDAPYLNTKLRGLLQKYQMALDELDYINGLSCAEVVFFLKNYGHDKDRTIQSIFEEYVENARMKQSTKFNYKIIWNTISKNLNTMQPVKNITYHTLLNLDKFLRDRNLSIATIGLYLGCLRAVINYAIKAGYVKFNVNPFTYYSFPGLVVRQCWLTVEEVKKIRDLDTRKRNIQKCRDFFMLSYYLGGINIADLLEINFKEHPKSIRYSRLKTSEQQKINNVVEFDMPNEALEIIHKYMGKDGFLNVSPSQRKARMKEFFSLNMKTLAKLTGIKKIIFYSARKSFSQHAFNLGISTSTIDYILGHKLNGGRSSLYSYIYVTPKMASEAIRKVLDSLK